jgi:ubiquinone/menaquinone biosynthesis C-methylase UbiE
MAYYREQVLPRILDKGMATKRQKAIRARVCQALHGAVVEVGFGSGLNLPYYPTAVTNVVAIEPSAVSMRLAEPRIKAASVRVDLGGLTGEQLDLPSAQFDAVLSTWTLCTIPDLEAALAEMRRVLRPGGSLHFVEHGHAPEVRLARWQARLEPLNKRLVGGCHLTRDISKEIEAAGFEINMIETYYFEGAPKLVGYTYEGRAVSP